jgi:hypothetical protein
MTAAEFRDKWGVPDWSKPQDYPSEATDRVWRWEFLRRRWDYRDAWSEWSPRRVMAANGVSYCYRNPDDVQLRFGVRVVLDPRLSMSDEAIDRALALFQPASGYASWEHYESYFLQAAAGQDFAEQVAARHRHKRETEEAAGIVSYRFDLSKSIERQIIQARDYLLVEQKSQYGDKKNTRRPSRELWSRYLRALDARDCGASWQRIGKAFWPREENVKDKALRTHEEAERVRDNFPI